MSLAFITNQCKRHDKSYYCNAVLKPLTIAISCYLGL